MNYVKKLAAGIFTLGFIFLTGGGLTYAAPNCANPGTSKEAIQCGSDNVSGQNATGAQAGTAIDTTIQHVIKIISTIGGVIAVVMIVVGGLRYVTSGGDSSKITSAKNTLVYALIGLVIMVLAQVIARFVLSSAT